MVLTKYTTSQVIWVNLFTLYVIHHIGITQRPHDRLVQKSRHLGVTWVHKFVSKQKSTNLFFFLFMIVTKYIARQVIWVKLFTLYVIHHIGITHKSHDNLVQKSRHLVINQQQTKFDKFDFCFMIVTKYIIRQVIWVKFFTLYVVHHIGITHKPHDHLVQKSRHLVINQQQAKIDKFDFFFFMIVTKYITRQVIWVHLFTLYVIHHTGITQRPHDHLVQKSRHLDKLVSKQKSKNLNFFLYD